MTGSPPPDDLVRALLQWNADPIVVIPCVSVGVLYGMALRRLRPGDPAVPPSRPRAFLSGLAVVVLALASPIDAYADVLFSVHMVQHLLLAFVAPPLLALGAPVTLALRSTTPAARRLVLRCLRSRPASVLTHPVVGWALFAVVPFVVHFTPVYQASLERPWVHAVEHGAFLGAGILFWWPIVGRDPIPHGLAYPARLLSLLLAMAPGGFVAVAIYSATAPLYERYASLPAPWGSSSLADQRWGAAIMWVAASLMLIVAGLLVAAAWRRHDEDRQVRTELQEGNRSTPAGAGREAANPCGADTPRRLQQEGRERSAGGHRTTEAAWHGRAWAHGGEPGSSAHS